MAFNRQLFLQKPPSSIFDRVLNTPLLSLQEVYTHFTYKLFLKCSQWLLSFSDPSYNVIIAKRIQTVSVRLLATSTHFFISNQVAKAPGLKLSKKNEQPCQNNGLDKFMFSNAKKVLKFQNKNNEYNAALCTLC